MSVRITHTTALNWVGHRVHDWEGARVGRVHGLIVDRETGEPLWLLIDRDTSHHVATPLDGVVSGGGRITVPWPRATIYRGPNLPQDGGLSPRQERELCDLFERTPTRGAQLSRWERRRSGALARFDPAAENGIAWDPPPRGPSPDRRDEPRLGAPTGEAAPGELPAGLVGRVHEPPHRD